MAVIGLPCVLKGIARARLADPLLALRITHLASIACGQTKSIGYTEFLGRMMGLPSPITAADYRLKTLDSTSDGFLFRSSANHQTVEFPFSGLPGSLWGAHWFTPRACHYCDDLFGEVADASFMDAWLERYMTDGRGTSIVVTRTVEAEQLGRSVQVGDLQVERVPLGDVVKSQSTALGTNARVWSIDCGVRASRVNRPPRRESMLDVRGEYLIG